MIISYIHFTAVVVPLFFVIMKRWEQKKDGNNVLIEKPSILLGKKLPCGKRIKNLSYYACVVILSSLFLMAILPDIWGSLGTYMPIFKNVLDSVVQGKATIHESNQYMGDLITPFSNQWFSFFFGALSQQHFPPFVIQNPLVIRSLPWVIYSGFLVLFLGVVSWSIVAIRSVKLENGRKLFLFTIYIAGLFSVAVHHFLVQQSLYVQAKGAQNVLVVLFVIMVLPFAVLCTVSNKNKGLKLLIGFFGLALIAFCVTLLISRTVHTFKLAYSLDRASILGSSYFSEANRIMQSDDDPFVWFEPRLNSDIYLCAQPFAGKRMVITQHLFLQTIYTKNKPGEPFRGFEIERGLIASDYVTKKDLPHLWILSSNKSEQKKSYFAGPYFEYKWEAKKVIDYKRPQLLFSGNNYEVDFAKYPRSGNPLDVGFFSYLRNGSVMVYLPAGGPFLIEVKLQPRDRSSKTELNNILIDVKKRVSAGEFGTDVLVENDHQHITIKHQFPPDISPRLALLARYNGEFWFNAMWNGNEFEPEVAN